MESRNKIVPGHIYVFTITLDTASERLDKYIAAQFTGYSRTFIQDLITQGYITVNTRPVKPSYTLRVNDEIRLKGPEIAQKTATPGKITLPVEIIYSHDDFLVLNKPAGLMVHPPESTGESLVKVESEPTLIDWIGQNHSEIAHIGVIDRPGIVHRLDKDTSGIIIIARTNYAHAQFTAFFKDRTIHKTYHALVEGHPPREGTISFPIGRHPILRHKMATFTQTDRQKSSTIREAVTHYRVLEYFETCSLVELKPVTGRTHQIRVHMAAISHPLLGDQTYGKKSSYIKRHALHAYAISFAFGSTEYELVCPKPTDFAAAEQALKNKQ